MKVATIGTGFITEWFLNAVEQNEGICCAAMYSRKAENAQALADKYDIKDIYTDLDEMLKRDDIDFIYVASPNSLHFEYSYRALQAGKHVICEKPFTSTVEEFETLASYAKQHHLFLFEAIVTLHMPNYHTIRENLSRLGQIRMIQCNFSQYSSRYDALLAGKTPNVFNPAFSGGALSDINIYNLHYVIGLFGKPQNVHYYANRHVNGIDTSGVAILEYDGFQAVCVGCKDTKSVCIAQIQGEKGYITMNSETSKCSQFTLTANLKSEECSQLQRDPALYYELKDFHRIYKEDDYEECLKLLDHSRVVMEVYEAARKDASITFAADH